MSPSNFIRSLAAFCALALSSCAFYGSAYKPASPEPGTHISWPNAKFTEVRAYCYDYTADKESSFFINGRMHAGVMDAKGVKLTSSQTKRLLAAVTVSQARQGRSVCYKPHHAFVFYDAKGNVVAVFEMCFGCNKFVATPGGLPVYVDSQSLLGLTMELKLPYGKDNRFYTDACRKKY